MHFRTAAVLLVAAGLLQACAIWHDYDDSDHRGGHGGGKPFMNVQKLQPVKIVGVNPTLNPSERFSMAICTQSPCNLTVQVDASCNIMLDPQYMGLRYANPSMDFTLVFKLQSSNGHRFAQTPIDLKSLGGYNPQIDLKSPQEVWVTVRNAQQARRLLYGVVVADANGKQCGELDPGVIPDL